MLRKALQVCIAPTRRRRLSTRPYYITTPIFYPNSVPHIGHLHSLVIADIFARYQRVLNPSIPVIFLAGTDEHGLKIQKAAQAKALPASELCDQLSQQFRVCSYPEINPLSDIFSSCPLFSEPRRDCAHYEYNIYEDQSAHSSGNR